MMRHLWIPTTLAVLLSLAVAGQADDWKDGIGYGYKAGPPQAGGDGRYVLPPPRVQGQGGQYQPSYGQYQPSYGQYQPLYPQHGSHPTHGSHGHFAPVMPQPVHAPVENVYEQRAVYQGGPPHRHVVLLNSDFSYRITLKGDDGWDGMFRISGPYNDIGATDPTPTKPLAFADYDNQKESLPGPLGRFDACAVFASVSQRDAGFYLIEVLGVRNQPGSYLLNVQKARWFEKVISLD
jgi:hypothetical protein